MPSRQQYVQQRVGARMQNRGEPMILRRVSMLPGPEPFRNPPDISSDLTIRAGSITGGQAYLGLAGSTAIGRLIAGDIISATLGLTTFVMTVVAMPATVMTDSDGIPLVDGSLNPVFGTPPVYNADALAADNVFPVVPVTGIAAPASLIGVVINGITFAADAQVYGVSLSFEQMTRMGWTEVDTIGLSIAGHNINPAPKVNDLVILNGGTDKRAIVQTGNRSLRGVNFLFPVQAR